MGHTKFFSPESSGATEGQWEKVKEVIEHVESKGIPFVTSKEAMKHYGNAVSVGDEHQSQKRFMVANDGTVETNQLLKVEIVDDGSINEDTSYSRFKPNTMTIAPIIIADKTNLPTSAGILYTRRFGDRINLFTQQTYEPYNNNVRYTRKYDYPKKTWLS